MKKIYVVFHLNSGMGAERNRMIMKELGRHFDNTSTELSAGNALDVFIPHNEIEPETPEHEAMQMCFNALLRSDEVWHYEVLISARRNCDGLIIYDRPFPYSSENISAEWKVAKLCGIPFVKRGFPGQIQAMVEALFTSWEQGQPRLTLAE